MAKKKQQRARWAGHKLEGQVNDSLPDQMFRRLEEEYADLGRRTRAQLEAAAELNDEHGGALMHDGTVVPWTDEQRATAWACLKGYEPAFKMLIDEDEHDQDAAQAEADEVVSAMDDAGAADEPDDFAPTRYLECTLTREEIDTIREGREDGDAEIDRLSSRLEGLKADAKSAQKRIDILLEDGLNASRKIRSGVEMRNVKCEERRELDPREDSPTRGQTIVITYRLDTKEPIDWRELRAGERQGRLFEPSATGDTVSVPAVLSAAARKLAETLQPA